MAHLVFGLLYALFFSLGFINTTVSAIMLLAAIGLAVFLKSQRSFVDQIVSLVEREDHFWNVPLKGLIYFILGCTITITYFSFVPALAGILILSVTDSIGTLYGKYMGVIKIRWNPNKHMEGPIIGGVLATVMCYSFLPFVPALVASFVGAFIDTFNMRILGFVIDDNLVIPIVSALVVQIMI